MLLPLVYDELESAGDLKGASTQVELAASYSRLASSLADIGNLQEAVSMSMKALGIVEPLASTKNPPALYVKADALFVAGEIERTLAIHSAAEQQRQHWTQSRDWYQKGLETWRQIPDPGAVSPIGYPCGNPHEVENAIALCDRALRKAAANIN